MQILFYTPAQTAPGLAKPSIKRVSGVKWSGCAVTRSPESSVEVKREWSRTSTPPTCVYSADRYNFNFHLFLVLIPVYFPMLSVP